MSRRGVGGWCKDLGESKGDPGRADLAEAATNGSCSDFWNLGNFLFSQLLATGAGWDLIWCLPEEFYLHRAEEQQALWGLCGDVVRTLGLVPWNPGFEGLVLFLSSGPGS